MDHRERHSKRRAANSRSSVSVAFAISASSPDFAAAANCSIAVRHPWHRSRHDTHGVEQCDGHRAVVEHDHAREAVSVIRVAARRHGGERSAARLSRDGTRFVQAWPHARRLRSATRSNPRRSAKLCLDDLSLPAGNAQVCAQVVVRFWCGLNAGE